jgi:hypothetical protein
MRARKIQKNRIPAERRAQNRPTKFLLFTKSLNSLKGMIILKEELLKDKSSNNDVNMWREEMVIRITGCVLVPGVDRGQSLLEGTGGG